MATRERAIPFGGTSGTDLNFKVVGGTAAPTAFNAENVIWINTNEANPNYILSHIEPIDQSNYWIPMDYDEGIVSFNALVNNGLIIHPLQPRQWDGDQWKRMSGALYQNGVITQTYSLVPDYLYNTGNQYTNDTGGWAAVTTGGFWYWGWQATTNTEDKWDSTASRTQGATFGESYVELSTNGSYTHSTIRTNNTVDLSNISQLVFNFNVTQYPGTYTTCYQSVTAAVSTSTAPGTASTFGAGNTWTMTSSGNGKSITLDVANCEGSYYIYFGLSSGAGYSSRIQLTSIQVNL